MFNIFLNNISQIEIALRRNPKIQYQNRKINSFKTINQKNI